MTIKDVIIKTELTALKERLEKMKEMDAPDIIIDSLLTEINNLESGSLKIGGDKSLLNTEFVSSEIKTGSGGKRYVHFNNGINYFPQARYGRYIAKGEK